MIEDERRVITSTFREIFEARYLLGLSIGKSEIPAQSIGANL
jgi:hypothetical protein